jgi:signal transduction histidine kinase
MPITSEVTGSVIGFVFVSSDSSTIVGAWTSFIWVFLAVALAVMLLALLMSLVTSKRMAKPLGEMAAAARKFAHGDFSVRVTEDKGTDELAALTSSFNNMADSLEKSEELRNEFIANVSHELRTPMTTISGFADGILDGTIPKDDEEKYLATIADETRRLSRLVRHMLELSRMKSMGADLSRRREFDINELIIRTLLNFETRAEDKGLDVDIQLPEKHMTVVADPDAITQVLYNLLDNAVKFAAKSSVLCVSLWKEDGKAYISVKNRGETIPEDDLPLIFDRFHKSDRSRGLDRDGVGLGLYLVKTILDSHNEDIAVTSRDGLTEFVFSLTLGK